MLLRDLLLESINLSKYRDKIRDGIKTTLERVLRIHVPVIVKDEEDDEVRAIVNYLSSQLYGSNIRSTLAHQLGQLCNEIMKLETDARSYGDRAFTVSVLFSGEISSGGFCKFNLIGINRYTILDKLLNRIKDSYIEGTVASSFNTIEEYNQHVKKYGVELDLNDSWYNPLIDILLHEMVHAIQHYKQFRAGRSPDNLEYRSYLEKDKSKFHNMINKNIIDKHYYGSPQEIAAHAHNISLEIINDYGVDKNWEPKAIPSDLQISKNVNRYLQNVFSGELKDPKVQKIMKRYYKLVYKEVVDYLSNLYKEN